MTMMQFRGPAPGPGEFHREEGVATALPGPDPTRLPRRWAAAEVTVVGADTQQATLTLQRGVTVSGRLVFDGSASLPADLTTITIALTNTQPSGDASSGFARVGADGRFTITDVIPGAYRVNVLAGGAWRAKTAEADGRDALDFSLVVDPQRAIPDVVVTMTTRRATIAGTLNGVTGQPASDCTILVFADDPQYWTPQSRRIQATRPATDGRFSFSNLPAGAYRLVAVEEIEDGRWFDPTVLQQVAGAAIAITLGEGETRTQDVRLAR
jgi:hypothetical protein